MLWMVSPTESVTETVLNGLIDCPSDGLAWHYPGEMGRAARTSTWEVTAGACRRSRRMPISVMGEARHGEVRQRGELQCIERRCHPPAGLAAVKVYVPGGVCQSDARQRQRQRQRAVAGQRQRHRLGRGNIGIRHRCGRERIERHVPVTLDKAAGQPGDHRADRFSAVMFAVVDAAVETISPSVTESLNPVVTD
jgi:hypothetical protein